jgi:2,3-bisphosphoglycerate-independent phosphoglycerate mutase
VGHTGVFEAAVKACETVDACTREVVTTALANDSPVS